MNIKTFLKQFKILEMTKESFMNYTKPLTGLKRIKNTEKLKPRKYEPESPKYILFFTFKINPEAHKKIKYSIL